MSAAIFLFIILFFGTVAYLIGYLLGNEKGYSEGFENGTRFAAFKAKAETTKSTIRGAMGKIKEAQNDD